MNVKMYGSPQNWIYRVKIGKTIWHGIYKYLRTLEDDPLNKFMPEEVQFKIDEKLEYLSGRVITIRGIPDSSRTFVKKDGTVDSPKIFAIEFKPELEDAERIGGEVYLKAVHDTVHFNYSSHECVLANSALAKGLIAKEKEKEEKKKAKANEKKKAEPEVEVEWVKRRRLEKEKEDKIQKRLGNNAGWNI